ncbi:MAG: hypothetical protein ACI89X_002669 [Planctomycetota bacterium]
MAETMRAHEPLTVGSVTYTWDRRWGQPFDAGDLGRAEAGQIELGNTHGCMVLRQNGNILVNTDAEHAVVEFLPDGRVTGTWGKQFQGGLHGMCLRVEDGVEVLYLVHLRQRQVIKTTAAGEVLWTLDWPEQSGVYENREQFNPTAVTVAPDGRIYIGDGYGKSWVHVYDRDRNYLKSFGGVGSEDGQLNEPHGLWMDTRGREPMLLVCDRENHRLQWFSLDGEFVRKMDDDLRRPCNVWPMPDGGLVIADLVGRISFLDAADKVVGHLGDNKNPELRAVNAVKRELWNDGEFLSPHSVCVDEGGDVYVMDWNSLGRISKLMRNT